MTNSAEWLSRTKTISRKHAAEAVLEDIRSAIESGQLAVGTRLPSEALLAETYGVSRPIVREALRSVQALGLTETRTGSGTYVVADAPRLEFVYGSFSGRDLMEARPCIEVPAAGWAARRRTEQQLVTLLELCKAMDEEEEPHNWVLLDSQFHSVIAEASGNAVFVKIVADIRQALTRQSEVVNLISDRRVASNEEHVRIAEAIRTGAEHDAREAMREHLQEVEQVVMTIIDGGRAPRR